MKAKGLMIAAAIALSAGPAFALVGNGTKQGSLLIFPSVTVESGKDTAIEISNDQFSPVHVQCFYVNEWKGRAYFDFDLSSKATASWTVGTRVADGENIAPAVFPNYAGKSANAGFWTPVGTSGDRGELICFAVDASDQNQISFNHLSGTATILDTVNHFAMRYNSYDFAALRSALIGEADNIVVGTPGTLILDGNGPGTYDACPVYNTTSFMPNGATLGDLHTFDNTLSVVSCNQDLRQDFNLHITKLKFDVWNSHQASFGGAFACVDSVASLDLQNGTPGLVNGNNFEVSTLRFADAQYRVQGVASTQCQGSNGLQSENVPLLGIATASVAGLNSGADEEIGGNLHAAGMATGTILWDPGIGSQARAKK